MNSHKLSSQYLWARKTLHLAPIVGPGIKKRVEKRPLDVKIQHFYKEL